MIGDVFDIWIRRRVHLLSYIKVDGETQYGRQSRREFANSTEQWLTETIWKQAEHAGIGMSEMGVFDLPQPNAFVTGMKRCNVLVAVSTGLLNAMSQDEVEAVLGRDISHMANGDMIIMGLLQGVLNTFVIFLSRIVGIVVD